MRLIERFRRDERGATAIEYALITATIFLVIVGALTLFAQRGTEVFISASDAIAQAR